MCKAYTILSVDFQPVFGQLDQSEQVFVVKLMRLLNEVSILSKAVLLANRDITEVQDPVRTAQRVTGLFFLRELAGKLWQGWQLLQTSYFGAGLSKQYDQSLKPEATQALDCIKQYFGQQANPLKFVRDKHVSHYDACVIKRELEQRSPNEPLPAFVAEERGNCLFIFADDIATRSVLRSFREDEGAAMGRLIEEIAIKVPGWFQDFGGEMLMALPQRGDPAVQELDLEEVPRLSEVTFPFFVRHES